MLIDKNIYLKPLLNESNKYSCKNCDMKLDIDDFFIGGWRSVFQGRCTSCFKEYIFDMPVFTGIPYPSYFDIQKKRNVNIIPKWWNEPFLHIQEEIKKNTKNVILDVIFEKKNEELIIINACDFVFGHSIMKIEHLTHYLKNEDYKEYDILIIIPKQIDYLIPDSYKISKIIVNNSFSDSKKFYREIDLRVKMILKNYEKVQYSMLPYPEPKHLRLSLLNMQQKKFVDVIKKIVIVYRRDRTIGRNSIAQFIFYSRLIKKILKIEKINIYIIGEKDQYQYRNIIDKRTYQFTNELDIEWNKICSGAITIGVHGSNMLLPSLCSSYNIEVLPRNKLYNFGQASMFSDTLSALETINKYRFVYGNKYMSDVKPKTIFEIIRSICTVNNNTLNAIHCESSDTNLDKVRDYYSSTLFEDKKIANKYLVKIIYIIKKIKIWLFQE